MERTLPNSKAVRPCETRLCDQRLSKCQDEMPYTSRYFILVFITIFFLFVILIPTSLCSGLNFYFVLAVRVDGNMKKLYASKSVIMFAYLYLIFITLLPTLLVFFRYTSWDVFGFMDCAGFWFFFLCHLGIVL